MVKILQSLTHRVPHNLWECYLSTVLTCTPCHTTHTFPFPFFLCSSRAGTQGTLHRRLVRLHLWLSLPGIIDPFDLPTIQLPKYWISLPSVSLPGQHPSCVLGWWQQGLPNAQQCACAQCFFPFSGAPFKDRPPRRLPSHGLCQSTIAHTASRPPHSEKLTLLAIRVPIFIIKRTH